MVRMATMTSMANRTRTRQIPSRAVEIGFTVAVGYTASNSHDGFRR
jgi:hypothetical protein